MLDAIKLTNAETTDEAHPDRVAEAEITIVKDVDGHFIFPVISEEWRQPHDERKVTRRILKKGDLVMPKKNGSEGNSSHDEDEEENSYDDKVIRSKKTKRAPTPPVETSESEAASGTGAQRS